MPPYNKKVRKEEVQQILCVTIGEGNLLLCCLKYLSEAGYDVITAFTNTPAVRTYCEDNEIPHWERAANLKDILKDVTFDYLFSISNPRIITESILKLPRQMSINYHDSPLPAYAGVYATSWALINGEMKHGISWHVIETGIDNGDILQLKEVNVTPTDSALTLNLKCQEAEKESFRILIKNSKADKVPKQRQPKTGRSYYGLHAIPPNAGVLLFETKSSNIYNIARALEFGNHDNALGSPKLSTSSGDFFLVTNVELARSDIYKSKCPGTVLDIVDDTLVVSTLDTPLLVSFANLDGTYPVPCTYKYHDIYTGAKLLGVQLNTEKTYNS